MTGGTMTKEQVRQAIETLFIEALAAYHQALGDTIPKRVQQYYGLRPGDKVVHNRGRGLRAARRRGSSPWLRSGWTR
jgi:hypothetical protein